MVETEDLIFLIRAVNTGDYSVLPIIADCLEEQGNSWHIGLRQVILLGKIPCDQTQKNHRAQGERTGIFSWYNEDGGYSQDSRHYEDPEKELGKNYYNPHYQIQADIFHKLRGEPVFDHVRDYSSRWDAYKDLAIVLTERGSDE